MRVRRLDDGHVLGAAPQQPGGNAQAGGTAPDHDDTMM
jgi:hypothetical protein